MLFLLFIVFFCWAKEKPSFCIFWHQPEISIETNLVSISKWLYFWVLTKFKISSEQTNCFDITFKIIQNNIFDRRCTWFMDELIVVVEKRKTGNFRMRQIFHGYNLIEFWLVFFEDVNVLGYFFTIIIFVLFLEINISVTIDVIKNSTYFGKTGKNLCHEHFRISYLLVF